MVLKFISFFLLIFACSNLICEDYGYQYEKSTDDNSSIQTTVIVTAVLVSFIAGGFVASIYFSGNNSQNEETSESSERILKKSSGLFNDSKDFAEEVFTHISNNISSVCSYGAELWNSNEVLRRNFDCEEYVDNFDRENGIYLVSKGIEVYGAYRTLYFLKGKIASIGFLLSNLASFITNKKVIGPIILVILALRYYIYYFHNQHYNNLFVNPQDGKTSNDSSQVNKEPRDSIMHFLDPAREMHTALSSSASRASLYLVDSWDGYGLNKYFDLRKRFEVYKLDGFIGEIFRLYLYVQTARFVMPSVPWLFSKFLGNTASTVSPATAGTVAVDGTVGT